jgi:hypothetical protein
MKKEINYKLMKKINFFKLKIDPFRTKLEDIKMILDNCLKITHKDYMKWVKLSKQLIIFQTNIKKFFTSNNKILSECIDDKNVISELRYGSIDLLELFNMVAKTLLSLLKTIAQTNYYETFNKRINKFTNLIKQIDKTFKDKNFVMIQGIILINKKSFNILLLENELKVFIESEFLFILTVINYDERFNPKEKSDKSNELCDKITDLRDYYNKVSEKFLLETHNISSSTDDLTGLIN